MSLIQKLFSADHRTNLILVHKLASQIIVADNFKPVFLAEDEEDILNQINKIK